MKSFRKQVENIKKKRMAENHVVSLHEFRNIKKEEKLKNILVVDDDEVMRSAIKRVLENNGYSVKLAEDGVQLSIVLETLEPDLILLDVNLPWVDGNELCHLIRSHQFLHATPVVMISAHKSPEDIQKGIAAGALDFIPKPFDIDHLLSVVNKYTQKNTDVPA